MRGGDVLLARGRFERAVDNQADHHSASPARRPGIVALGAGVVRVAAVRAPDDAASTITTVATCPSMS